jgi:hypothetical protein
VQALLHSVHDQPDAASGHAQFDGVLRPGRPLPEAAEHLEDARADVFAVTASPHGGVAADSIRPTLRASASDQWAAAVDSFADGRQHVASSNAAPPHPAISAMPRPSHPAGSNQLSR